MSKTDMATIGLGLIGQLSQPSQVGIRGGVVKAKHEEVLVARARIAATLASITAVAIAIEVAWPSLSLAQSDNGTISSTMQRLKELQQLDDEKQFLKEAEWRRFRYTNYSGVSAVEAAERSVMDALRSVTTSSTCEYYWPGWKLRSDGIRATKVRGCPGLMLTVAVNCRNLKVSWRERFMGKDAWSNWTLPRDEVGTMISTLCENIYGSTTSR